MTHAKLMKMNGKQVKCIIEKEEILGIISIEDGLVFVCQDTFRGTPCTDRKGKKCSWLISSEKEPYEDCDRRCSDIVPVKENKWFRRFKNGKVEGKKTKLVVVKLKEGELCSKVCVFGSICNLYNGKCDVCDDLIMEHFGAGDRHYLILEKK